MKSFSSLIWRTFRFSNSSPVIRTSPIFFPSTSFLPSPSLLCYLINMSLKVYPTSSPLSPSLSHSFPPLSHPYPVLHFSPLFPWYILTSYLLPLSCCLLKISLPSSNNLAKHSAPFIPRLSSFPSILFPHPLLTVYCSFLISSSCSYILDVLPKLYLLILFQSSPLSICCPLPDSTRAPLLLDLRSSLRPSDHERDLGRRRKRRLRRRETWPKHALDTAASSAGLMAGVAICAHLCPWHSLAMAASGSVALRWGLPVCPEHPPLQGCVGLSEERLGTITSLTRPLSPLSLCHSASLTLCLSLVFSHSAELALMQRPHVLLSAALLKLQTLSLSYLYTLFF